MDKLNYAFFEEFKHLDKICGEIYQSQKGVTDYIEDMKSVTVSNYRNIPNWKDDLKQLQRLRHIRNYLAHEEGAFDRNACTQNDIDWVQKFYRRILHQCDPLAVLYQNGKNQHKNQATNQAYISEYKAEYTYNRKDNETKNSNNVIIAVVINLLIALIVITSFIIMMK